MELWYTEYQLPDVGITFKTSQTLHTEKTEFQELAVIDTLRYGRMLVLDGTVQTTIFDEYVYHEMISHIPLNTHKHPRSMLVVGGGDGGAIREILKHQSIERAVLAEIDGRVIDAAKKYLPEISCALDDPRVEICVCDGIKYVSENKNSFDVIAVDSTDPVGPAVGLFALDFYKSIYNALTDDGIFVAQTESPFYHGALIKKVFDDVSSVFPITRLYTCPIPTYPGGYWSFTMGSKRYDPLLKPEAEIKELDTKYYCAAIHKAAFALPKFVAGIISGGSDEKVE
jgi:spermidine synthase